MFSVSRTLSLPAQLSICVATVGVAALACAFLPGVVGYRTVALLLLLAVSILAMLFDTAPVLTASVLSALVWNFFFIPPVFTFHIGSTEDVLMFLLYFVVALVNAVLNLRIRKADRRERDREQQERSLALYTTLFNSLSHELRTPIAAIVGSVDTLQQNAQLDNTQRAELLGTIEDAGTRLERQVKNLLNMQRLESAMLLPKPDWCDVNETIGDVLHRSNVSGHAVLFAPDPALPLFKLDGGLLEQVLHNLLHNALVYTPNGCTITIIATHADGRCRITVSDDGPGIPEGEWGRVFDKFHRLPNTARGGSGLGLSIVKGFVEAMGGTVRLEANTPRGARFAIDLPAETSFLNNLKHD